MPMATGLKSSVSPYADFDELKLDSSLRSE
jgi:hypothetical protein